MSLSDRMKDYEENYDYKIVKRVPVIIRVDGKRFSKYVKSIKAEKPFDQKFSNAMMFTSMETAKKMEGCVLAFTQSDEITYILKNDQSEQSEAWFGNRLQKMVSVCSSMTTAHFVSQMAGLPVAYFDARVFAVPDVQEAINCLIWRQNDAIKNSVSSACYYEVGKVKGKKTSRAMMQGLNQDKQKEMLLNEANIKWEDYPIKYQRGAACYKIKVSTNTEKEVVERTKWIADTEIPVFSKDQEFLRKIFEER